MHKVAEVLQYYDKKGRLSNQLKLILKIFINVLLSLPDTDSLVLGLGRHSTMFIMLCFDLLVSNYCEALGGIIKLSRDLLQHKHKLMTELSRKLKCNFGLGHLKQ